jgi:hypothetical protein
MFNCSSLLNIMTNCLLVHLNTFFSHLPLGWGTSVDAVNVPHANDHGFVVQLLVVTRDFTLLQTSRLVLSPTQPPSQWVMGHFITCIQSQVL